MFFLIAGLGNPGPRYSTNRHNVGFAALERLATRHGIELGQRRFAARLGVGRIAERQVCLLEPQTYMNLSGEAVGPAARFYRVAPGQLAVLHDDMDLELGRIQLRRGGGDGGHRGLRSVIEHLGQADFVRLRLGVGRPAAAEAAVDHVLSGFAAGDEPQVEAMLERAADALECWLADGLTQAMNRFNPWRSPRPEEGREAEPGSSDP